MKTSISERVSTATLRIRRLERDETLSEEERRTEIARIRKIATMMVTESYNEVKALVHMQCHRFVKRYGQIIGTTEEVIELGMVFFCEAYERFDPARAAFTTLVGNHVWIRLINEMRIKHEEYHRFPREARDLRIEPQKHSHFDTTELLDKLSDDGKTVANLVLDTPIDIQIKLRKCDRKTTPSKLRSAIKRFLKDIGWAMDRISEAFTEVGEALRS